MHAKIAILACSLLALPAWANPAKPLPAIEAQAISQAQKQAALQTLINKVQANYVFPEVAQKVAAALKAHDKAGAYQAAANWHDFAKLLTEHLQAASQDKHFRVGLSPLVVAEDAAPGQPPVLSAEQQQADQAMLRSVNYGVEKFERLPGNIAYVELTGFADPQLAGENIAAVMNLAAQANALIIDLRRNGGGEPATVALITSYLLDAQPVHLNDMLYRYRKEPIQYWSHAWVPGKRFGSKKPLYVLTSKHTFSAAEEFSYNLKNLKRATLIGETTGGGAHPGEDYKLAPHMSVFIPNGRARNPISGSNWEGVGVTPDQPVAAEQALALAHWSALQGVIATEQTPRRKSALEKIAQDLKAKFQTPGK
ncbi:S41 family peptidase [Massilia sp. W12]|uniref:S41 family peptidase n=1 Tax=Massilia sp. W12 TaxID=3126507 RepID=UPI0030D19D76